MGLLSAIAKGVSKIPIIGKVIAKAVPSSVQDIGLQGIANKMRATLAASAVAATPVAKSIYTATIAKPISAATSYALGSPTQFIKSVAVGGVVAGGGLKVIPKVFTAAKDVTSTALPVLLGEEKLSKENVGDVIKTVGAATGIGLVAAGAAVIVDKVINNNEQVLPTNNTNLPTGTNLIPTNNAIVPLTPATQVLGKPVSTTKKKKKAKKAVSTSPTIRLNVINANQSRIGVTRNYLNQRSLNSYQ